MVGGEITVVIRANQLSKPMRRRTGPVIANGESHMPTSWPEMRLHKRKPLFEDPIELSIVSDSQLLAEGLAALIGQYLTRCTITRYTGLEIPDRLHQLRFQC